MSLPPRPLQAAVTGDRSRSGGGRLRYAGVSEERDGLPLPRAAQSVLLCLRSAIPPRNPRRALSPSLGKSKRWRPAESDECSRRRTAPPRRTATGPRSQHVGGTTAGECPCHLDQSRPLRPGTGRGPRAWRGTHRRPGRLVARTTKGTPQSGRKERFSSQSCSGKHLIFNWLSQTSLATCSYSCSRCIFCLTFQPFSRTLAPSLYGKCG